MDAATHPAGSRWLLLAAGAALLFNLLVLLSLQHYIHGDFPFEDEWGYLARLQRLPDMGLVHFIFDRHIGYYLPVLFSFWYLSYTLTHLDFELMRYVAAGVSVGAALLLAFLLYRRATRRDWLVAGSLVYGAFLVCSLNHYYIYFQASEALIEPFLFGMVLCAVWAQEAALTGRRHLVACTLLATAFAAIGAGTYGAGLSILPALAAAQILLLRRMSYASLLQLALGVALIVLYVHGTSDLSRPHSAATASVTDLLEALRMWVGLTGNALFTPRKGALIEITYGIGLLLVAAQAYILVSACRQPPDRRRALFIPVALALYNNLVILEIILTRLHDVENGTQADFNPRYTILTLGGPASVLFYAVMLGELPRRLRHFAAAALFAMFAVTLISDRDIAIELPYHAQFLARVRTALLSLQGYPTPLQQAHMQLNPDMKPLVYPGRLFLEKEHLALYRDSVVTPPSNPP